MLVLTSPDCADPSTTLPKVAPMPVVAPSAVLAAVAEPPVTEVNIPLPLIVSVCGGTLVPDVDGLVSVVVVLGSVGDGLAPEIAAGKGDESGDCRSRLLSCLVIGVLLLAIDRACVMEPVLCLGDSWLCRLLCRHCACCIHAQPCLAEHVCVWSN